MDYSACIRCKNMGYVNGYEVAYYCRLDNSKEPKVWENKFIPHEIFMLGCPRFEWNGLPIHKKAYEIIESKHADSVLIKLPKEEIIKNITLLQIMKEQGLNREFENEIGAGFNREKFKQDHPDLFYKVGN